MKAVFTEIRKYKATNGYEQRRQSALAEFTSTRINSRGRGSAIALVQTKLGPGQSTDGAVFYILASKAFTVAWSRFGSAAQHFSSRWYHRIKPIPIDKG